MMKFLLFYVCFLCLPFIVFAQNVKLSKADNTFFETQLPYFQQWLDQNMANTFKIVTHNTDIENDRLTVRLRLNYQTADSANAVYKKLKTNFEAHEPIVLENALFYKTAQLMEIPTPQLNLEIIDQEECRKIRVTYQNDSLKVSEITCRAITKEVNIKDFYLKKEFTTTDIKPKIGSTESETDAIFKQRVLGKLKEESEKYFKDRKKAVFTLLSMRDGVLRFVVSDIKKEIIREASLFDRYELITFTMHCQKTPNNDTRIRFVIDAKSGVGFPWKARTSAFIPIDSTKEGKYQMEKYAYIFGAMTEQWLSK
jgi:hypothetical protein